MSPTRLLKQMRIPAAVTFAVFFMLTVRGVGDSFPSPGYKVFADKLSQFSESDPPCNLLFVGSSRVYRQIRPATFDSVLSAHGIDIHSYNFGIPGTSPFETAYLLRRVFDRDRNSRIRWVFVSLERLGLDLEETNRMSDRVSRYYGPRNFARAVQLAYADKEASMS
ncbi:MAG: hypothetical protein HKN20_12175, partial [Gemmatimonadetes bacterium]|nr:hypothetical protein [Gemmatimonadota bacterium]